MRPALSATRRTLLLFLCLGFADRAVAQTLTVTSPNGGENWTQGSTQSVTWTISGSTSTLNYQLVAYSTNSGSSYTNVSAALTAGSRSYSWTLPSGVSSTQVRVRVRAMDVNGFIKAEDASNSNFTISSGVTAPATPTSPSPGSTSSPGPTTSSSTVTVSWGASSGATYYGLGIRDIASNALVVDTNVTGTSYSASLSASKQYRWNVAACNTAGCSAYTTVIYFQTPTPTAALAITTTSLPAATVGTGYGQGLAASGGQAPYTWSVSSGLPAGLAINASVGSIFGTPTASGTFSFTVTVRDSSSSQQTASKALSLSVAAATTPVPATPTSPSPGSTSSPGPTTSSSTVTVSWAASSGATYYGLGIRDIASNALVVDTNVTGTSYSASLSASKQYRWNVAACDTAGCSAYTTVIYFQTPTPTAAALSITTTSLAGGTVGTGYGQGVGASGGQTPYTWSVSSGLPAGLAINASVGSIFGTPTASGTFSFTVTVRDSSSPQQTASKALSLSVAAAVTPVTPTSPSPGATSSPGPTTSSSTVTVSWGASSGATYYGLGIRDIASNALVVDTNVTGTSYSASLGASKQYRWNVAACNTAGCSAYTTVIYFQTPTPTAALAITTTSLPAATEGTGYGQGLAASGGQTPYTWSVSSGLPPGLAINASVGSIFGTPTASGTFSFTVTVRDSSSPQQTASKALSLSVAAATTPVPSISSVSPNPVTGSGSAQTLTINGSNFVNKPTLTLTWTGQSNYTVPSAQVTFVSSTQLTMSITTTTTPDIWTVKATNPDGKTSSAVGFQVVTANGAFNGRVVRDQNQNGSQDIGEPFIQAPGISCGNPGETVAGIALIWTGPASGNTTLNQCNPAPYYTSGLVPNGTYTVSISVPSGWTVVGSSSRTVTLPNPPQDPWFYLAPSGTVPAISSVTPSPVIGSTNTQTITLTGANFVNKPALTLTWSGQPNYTVPAAQVTFVSSTQLLMSITTTTTTDKWTVQVTNPDGESSNVASFQVVSPTGTLNGRVVRDLNQNGSQDSGEPFLQAPGITCGTPGETLAGLTISWTGPASGSTTINQCNPIPYFTSGAIASGTYSVSIAVPTGWTVVGPTTRTVILPNPVQDPWFYVSPSGASPSISSISPNPVIGSNTPQTVTISGSNFVSKPTVVLTWTGQGNYVVPSAQVTFLSAAQLQMSIGTTTTPDNWTVQVFNPDGKSSTPKGFKVVSPSSADDPQLLVDGSATSSKLQGSTFTVSATKLTAGKTAVRMLRSPAGNELPLSAGTSDSLGGLDWTIATTCDYLPGSYSVWVVDQTTSRQSSKATAIVQSSGSCRPDLIAGSLSLNVNTAIPGGNVGGTITFRNQGAGVAPGSKLTLRFAKSSTQLASTDPVVGGALIPSIPSSGSQLIPWTLMVPPGTEPGSYYIWAVADQETLLNETDISNNSATAPVSIQKASGCQVVCTVNAPDKSRVGVEVSFSSTAATTGCQTAPTSSWEFGDGLSSTASSTIHSYQTAQTFTWQYSAAAEGNTCKKSGQIGVTSGAKGALSGSVQTATGSPVVSATVSAQLNGPAGQTPTPPMNVTTDPQGAFRFADIEPGIYAISATKTGLVTQQDTVAIASGLSTLKSFVLGVPQSAVRVVSLKPQYSGLQYLLPGVHVPIQYAATVDWGSHPPKLVRFFTGSRPHDVPTSTNVATLTVNVDRDLNACESVSAVAISADNSTSPVQLSGGMVTKPLPTLFGQALMAAHEAGNGVRYEATASLKIPDFVNLGSFTTKSTIPLIGGKKFDIAKLIPSFSITVGSDGTAEIKATSQKFEINLTPNLHAEAFADVTASGTFVAKSCEWSWNAGLEFGGKSPTFEGSYPFLLPNPFLGGAPTIPAYFAYALGVEGNGKLTWQLAPIKFNGGSGALKVDLKGTLGVGKQEVIGVEGSLDAIVDLNVKTGAGLNATVDFQLVGSARAFLKLHWVNLGASTGDFQLAKVRIYPQDGSTSLIPQIRFNTVGSIELESRDYLNSPRRLNSRAASEVLFKPDAPSRESLLETAVFPHSDPALDGSGDTLGLVFISDDETRTSINRARAMASFRVAGAWTTAKAIGDDGTADYKPQLRVFQDGSALAIWENASKVLADTAQLNEVIESLDVAASFYEPTIDKWSTPVALAANAYLDRNPRLAGPSRSQALAAWIGNPKNSLLGDPMAPNVVWSARWNGTSWSAPQQVATIPYPILKYDLSFDGSQALLVLSVDLDGDLSTADDEELLAIRGDGSKWQLPIRLTTDNTPDENPHLVSTAGQTLLAWSHGEEIRIAPDARVEQSRLVAVAGYSSNVSDFKMAAGADGRLAITWIKPHERLADLFGVFYDPLFGVWGGVTQLTDDDGTESNVAVAFDPAGQLVAVFNRATPANIPSLTSAAVSDSGTTDLVTLERSLSIDIGIVPGSLTLDRTGNSGSSTVSATIVNKGDLAVEGVPLVFYDGDPRTGAKAIATILSSDVLVAGAQATLSAEWLIPEGRAANDLYVVADPEALLVDRDRSNNVANTGVGRPDLTIQALPIERLSDVSSEIVVRVANIGAAASPAAAVTLREGTPAGKIITTMNTPTIAAGSSVDLSFSWAAAGGPLPGIIAAAVDPENAIAESNEANNDANIVVDCSLTLGPPPGAVPSAGGRATLLVTAPAGCGWSPATDVDWISFETGTSAGGAGSVTFVAAPYSGAAPRKGIVSVGDQSVTVSQFGAQPGPMTADKASFRFNAVTATTGNEFKSQTGTQTLRLRQDGPGTVDWQAKSSVPWLVVSPPQGTGSATLSLSVQFSPGLAATQTGTITLSYTGASNTSGSVTITLDRLSEGPTGAFETPIDGSEKAAGSIGVTGWAVSEKDVKGVRVFRDPVEGEPTGLVFLGDAVLVEGARPDVKALYPSLPHSSRAGWGYLLLTNFLPNLGNGTFTLYAYADDFAGNTMLLGTKTITCENSSAIAPFGAIDTPAQGETIPQGTFNNFGWVLSPGNRRSSPADGGAVTVFVDGKDVGSPSGWAARNDLSALFPVASFSGVAKALGVFHLDTGALFGVHTISWVVADSQGLKTGVGSRYFTVTKSSVLLDPPQSTRPGGRSTVIASATDVMMPAWMPRGSDSAALLAAVNDAPAYVSPINARVGFALDAPLEEIQFNSGVAMIQSEELGRIEVRLVDSNATSFTAYMRTPAGLTPLPVGSSLDPDTGVFIWQPGVAFVGAYDFVFVRWASRTAVGRQELRIVLNPKASRR